MKNDLVLNAGLRFVNFSITCLLWLFLALCCMVVNGQAQQPQVSEPVPQTLQGVNAKWANGMGPGYWPYQTAAGLVLTIGPGTAPVCMGGRVEYAGGTLTLTDNTTNYVYLDLDNNCAPTLNTVGYSNRNITLGKFVTSGGVVTSWRDDRAWSSSHVVFGGVNAQTGATYTMAATDRNKDVTFNRASAVAASLPATLGATFAVATQNLGAGTVTFTPTSGTINGAATLAMTTGQGGWLFFDGTNWSAVLGGSGGGGSTNTIHTCLVPIGDPNSNSATLQTGNNAPGMCGNNFGADETVTAVGLCIDAGASVFNTILTGGSGTSILTGTITGSPSCTGGTWVGGTVNGTPVIHSFSADGHTCPSTPCTVDVNISSVDGITRYAVMQIIVVGPGGAGGTPVGIGGAANHEMLYNNGGLVGGVANSTAGLPVVSNGPSSTPSQQQLPNSGLVNASTTVDGNTCTLGSTCVSNANPNHLINCPDSSGSGTAQICNTTPTFTPVGGIGGPNSCIGYTTTTANTGTGLTVNVNSLGVKSFAIAGASGWTTTLTIGIIPANKPIIACYDGTNWDVQQTGTAASGGGGGGSWTLLCDLSASSSATLDFKTSTCSGNNPFSSSYKEVVISFLHVVPVTNNVALQMFVSTDNGVTFDSTSGHYSRIAGFWYSGGVGTSGGSADTSTYFEIADTISNNSSYGVSGSIHVFDPSSSTFFKSILGQTNMLHATLNVSLGFDITGHFKITTTINAFRIQYSSGNISSGEIKVYGIL